MTKAATSRAEEMNGTNVTGVKAALVAQGHDCGPTRPPSAWPLTEAQPEDIMLGDGEGVMVIPAHLAEEIAEECTGMESYEDFVLEQVKAETGIIGLYPPTDEENLMKYAAKGQDDEHNV